MTPEKRKAEEAQRLLDDPMVKDAFSNVEDGLIAAMKAAKLGDQLTHHELVLCLQLLGRVEGYFKDAILTPRLREVLNVEQMSPRH